MTFKLGLTGSIGMGKSTTAQLFADEGCAVWDADAAVHRLYSRGGAAVAPMSEAFPEAIVDGAVSRAQLKSVITTDASALKKIEKFVHPLVAWDRDIFLRDCETDIAVLDIPLLFETGSDRHMDATVCVTAPPEIQRKRVLDRGSMSEAELDVILAKQMPDAEKRNRADFVIITDTLEHAREQVQAVVKEIRGRLKNA
ncbi:dephospho-CoA kinase [Roseovarius aestuarii]|uniref:Dephospho-CoA kinase n=1 Tax=Roseovarius aestuarii TaxID=475083 RepID=A0A1X7BR10_9RHOB|nr:dephospho-CoA kinase [Roseovarius aestuarii]SMC12014.1 Dephospho-CoA kinase [Roseovarius aestuarii]